MTRELLNQLLLRREKEFTNKVYLRQPIGHQWINFTWGEVIHQARQVATALKNAGLQRGDRVAIFSKNCAEWLIADFGISLAGLVNVPLFANQNPSSIEFIIQQADIQLVFIGKLDAHKKTREFIPSSIPTINLGYHTDIDTTYSWNEVLALPPLIDVVIPDENEIYTIIYSSGTTGEPKGAVYTHGTLADYLLVIDEDMRRVFKHMNHHHLISYLPLAHVYERTSVQLVSLVMECDLAFVESLEKFAKNLHEIQPTMFAAVPRIWGLFKQRIEQQLARKKIGWMLKVPILSSILKKKIIHQLGLSRCEIPISGAAHLPSSIFNFFKKLGLIIQEGSGQTENFGYTSLSMRDDVRPNCVGIPRAGVKIKQDENGELLVYSPCLMTGYYKDPELSKRSFTEDGWLRTGDLVEIDEANRLKIIGRISENFKNQKGEFVVPSQIEDFFAVSPMIEQCCLIGKLLPSNLLLVNLAQSYMSFPQNELNLQLRKLQNSVNRKLSIHEKISHIVVMKENWTISNHCLTPTMKVRRRIIESNYKDLIQCIITEPVGILWETDLVCN